MSKRSMTQNLRTYGTKYKVQISRHTYGKHNLDMTILSGFVSVCEFLLIDNTRD